MSDQHYPGRRGLHVCAIGPAGTDHRGEWVEIANDGDEAELLTGRTLAGRADGRELSGVYEFGHDEAGGLLLLDPARSAYVFSGAGRDERDGNGDLFVHAGRHASVWKGGGVVAELRDPDGTLICAMTVGQPKRHPYRH